MNKAILFESSAVKLCLEELKQQGYTWRNIKYLNDGRYCVVYGNPTVTILLKKDWFMNFGKMKFKGEEGYEETGIGETINCEELKLFVSEGVKAIYFIRDSGEIYTITLINFLLKSHRWHNKEGKEVRSVSVHHLKRVN